MKETENAEANPSGFAALSGVMYRTARRLTSQANQESGSDVHGLVVTVVVLCQAFLEAYLNELLEIQRHENPGCWETFVEDIGRVTLAGKYSIVARFVSGKTFDAGAEPFQSLRLLVTLRNEIVHYSPRFRSIGDLPKKMLQGLKNKFSLEYEGRTDWTAQVFTPGCAGWACDTVKSVIKKFHELIGGPNPWEQGEYSRLVWGD